MNWFFIALSCAVFTACCDAVSKRLMQTYDEWVTGTAVLGISSIMLIPIFLNAQAHPITTDFIILLMIALPLEIFAYYLFLSAIRQAPLSLTVPLLAFTPVLSIPCAYLVLGEVISFSGAVGIALVTIGAYILNAHLISANFFAPIKAVFSNPGSRRMLAVAIIWALTSTLGKKGVDLYGAIPFGCVILFGDFIGFLAIVAYQSRKKTWNLDISKRASLLFLFAGLLMSFAELTHFISLSMAPVAYMISVKRLSMVFGVILGWMFFNEQNLRYRLAGASAMSLGIFFINFR